MAARLGLTCPGCHGGLAAILQGLRGPRRSLRPAPGQRRRQRHGPRIGNDRAYHQEPPHGPQFPQIEARHEKQDGTHPKAQQQRQDLQADPRATRHDPDHGAQNRIAEQAPQTKGMRPVGGGHQRRGIDGTQRHRDHGKDDAAQRPLRSAMQQEPHPPCPDDHRQRPDPTPADDDQRRRQGRAEPAQNVACRFVRCHHPAGIIRRIGPEHQHEAEGDADQDQPQQFAPATFQHRLHVLIQKGIALPRLIGCHALVPHPYMQSRSLIRPRCISSLGATMATRIYPLPGFWPPTSRER